MTKYMASKILSSVFLSWKWYRGRRKKKSQIRALSNAADKTGRMVKKRAIRDNVRSNMNATTCDPIQAEKGTQMAETRQTSRFASKNCQPLLNWLFKINGESAFRSRILNYYNFNMKIYNVYRIKIVIFFLF